MAEDEVIFAVNRGVPIVVIVPPNWRELVNFIPARQWVNLPKNWQPVCVNDG